MKKPFKILIPILVIIIILVCLKLFKNQTNKDMLTLSGNIEVTDSELSFKISGRLLERLVDEGEEVDEHQLIAKLESIDQEILVSQAKANVAFREAVLAELKAGSRPEEISRAKSNMEQAKYALEELEKGSRSQEIADAEAELERTVASSKTALIQLEQAKVDFKRYEELLKNNATTEQEFEIYRTRYNTALSTYDEAEARVRSVREKLALVKEGPRTEKIKQARAVLDKAKAEYDLVKAGPRKEQIDQAEANLTLSKESLNQSMQQFDYTNLYAPFKGVVLSKSAEPGEYLNPGSPVVIIGMLDQVWLKAYINETNLGKINLNQEVDVTTDAYPDKVFKGHISFISSEAEFTPKSVQTFEERVKLMYRIKIVLDNKSRDLKPGMPADALIKITDHFPSPKSGRG